MKKHMKNKKSQLQKNIYIYATRLRIEKVMITFVLLCFGSSIVFDEQRQRKLTPATRPPMGLLSNQRESSVEKPKSLVTSATRSNAHGFFSFVLD